MVSSVGTCLYCMANVLFVALRHVYGYENVFCQPVPVVVPTDASGHFRYFPFYITLHRCAGSIPPTLRPSSIQCVAAAKEILSVSVTEVDRNENLVISSENHTKCESACVHKASDCNRYQTWSPEKCACVCGYQDVATGPTSLCPSTQVWSPNRCDCRCKTPESCPEGKEWNRTTCSCACSQVSRNSCKPPSHYDVATCKCINLGKSSSSSSGLSGAVPIGWFVVALIADAALVAAICLVCYKLYSRRMWKPWLQRQLSRGNHDTVEKINIGGTGALRCSNQNHVGQV